MLNSEEFIALIKKSEAEVAGLTQEELVKRVYFIEEEVEILKAKQIGIHRAYAQKLADLTIKLVK